MRDPSDPKIRAKRRLDYELSRISPAGIKKWIDRIQAIQEIKLFLHINENERKIFSMLMDPHSTRAPQKFQLILVMKQKINFPYLLKK